MTLEMVSKKQDRVREITDNIPKCLPGKTSLTSLKYNTTNWKQIEEICGNFTTMEKVVQLKTTVTEKRPETPATYSSQLAPTYFVNRPKTTAMARNIYPGFAVCTRETKIQQTL